MKLDLLELMSTQYTHDLQIEKRLLQRCNCFVGWVDKYNSNSKTVDVQPSIQNEILTKEQLTTYTNKPYLINVPIILNTLSRNPQFGDKVLVFVLDEKSNSFFKTSVDTAKPLGNQTLVNTSKAYKNISNCVALIINPNYGGGSQIDVIDNLNSTSTTDALSANQGNVLNLIKANLETDNIFNGNQTLYGTTLTQSQQPYINWRTINNKTPFIGYATDQVDGTFVIGSLLGTNYASGLAIGGGSGNLLWKGIRVATATDLASKQNTLVSGTNIKTINSQSLLGSGNIDVTGPQGPQGIQGPKGDIGATFTLSGTTLTITT